jgi:DNA-binding LytR/AlgR family response regulator
LEAVLQQWSGKKQSRLVVKRGQEHLFLLLEDVVLFYTENKIVYVIDKQGKKYLLDKNLSDLESELTRLFFSGQTGSTLSTSTI